MLASQKVLKILLYHIILQSSKHQNDDGISEGGLKVRNLTEYSYLGNK